MRTLSSTLTSAQKGIPTPLKRIVLTSGANTYTYTNKSANPIMSLDHLESPSSYRATVVLQDSDSVVSALTLKGYKGVISYGATTSAGDEYSACAPLWVVPQQTDAAPGLLRNTLTLRGIPDKLKDDRASQFYMPGLTDNIKTVVDGILAATLDAYSHCTAYTVTWDSLDDLVTSFLPKQTIKVPEGMSRWEAAQQFLQFTECVMRPEADGAIHILVPQTTGLQENYITGNDDATTRYGANWVAQTFTPATAHTVTSVRVKMYRVGSPGTVTVSIKAVDGSSHPTGADLASGTMAGSNLTTNTAGEWRVIKLGAGTALTATTKYAIVIRAADGGASDYIKVAFDVTSATYSGGAMETSADSGGTWTTNSTYDLVFAEYGGVGTMDYTYSHASGEHVFRAKSWQSRLVIPNYVTVHSFVGDVPYYTGYATDADYSTDRYDITESARLASNAQATSLAEAIIAKAQTGGEGGSYQMPNNVGQEVFDYVEVVSPTNWGGDTKYGNVGSLHRKIELSNRQPEKQWGMVLAIGGWLEKQGKSRTLVANVLGEKVGSGALNTADLSTITNVGATLIQSNDAAGTITDTTYTKVREIQIPCYGYLRVKFDLYGEDSAPTATAYGKLYRNGTALGTEQSTAVSDWTTYSEDLSGFKPNDLLQLYVKKTGTGTPDYRNFRLYWDDTGQVNAYTPRFVNTL